MTIDFKTFAKAIAKKNFKYHDDHMVMDAASHMWEAHERFLDKNNLQGLVLTAAQKRGLEIAMYRRGYFAMIDYIRFNSYYKKTKALKLDYLDTPEWELLSVESRSVEDAIYLKSFISSSKYPNILKMYLAGNTLRDIGTELDFTEGRVSQLIKEIIPERNLT